MTNTYGKTILVDSDALIGLIHKDDLLHERCIKIAKYLTQNNFTTINPYPTVLEAATALAKDKTIRRPKLALQILEDYAKVEEAGINWNVSDLVADLYDPKTSVKNSPFDHYVLALAVKNNIKYIFSFDSFYKKQGLMLAEDLLSL